MARSKSSKQEEIPETISSKRIGELHALAAEIYELQEDRKALTLKEAGKREDARVALAKHGIDHYHHDGWELYLDAKSPKVKVARDDDEG